MRFCARCGFPMEGTLHLLAHGGMIPQYQQNVETKEASPRRKGVKQGALLMLIGAILVPILGVMSGFAPGRLENLKELIRSMEEYESLRSFLEHVALVMYAEQKEAQLDVDQLVVRKITVDKGPQEKRVRPAPMGRAYRVLHRKSHLTIELSDEA